jgi:hypothetical protein
LPIRRRRPALKYIAAPTRRFLRAEATAVSQKMLEEHRGDGLFYEWLVDDILEIVPCGVNARRSLRLAFHKK